MFATAALFFAAACTTEPTPATTPPTTAPATDATMATSDSATSTSSTTTSRATTTTTDRLAEVTAIFQDLEERRLEAIYTGDREAFASLFADTPYLDRSLEVFDFVEPGPVPQVAVTSIQIVDDSDTCLVFRAGGQVAGVDFEPVTVTLTPSGDGWLIAYTTDAQEGWLCDGLHPLSG